MLFGFGVAHNMVFAVEILQLLRDFECSIRTCIVYNDYLICQIAVRLQTQRWTWPSFGCDLLFSKGTREEPDYDGKVLAFIVCW